MSISQNFPEEGPSLNLNFAGSRTLDPRITFTRTQTTSNGSTYMGRDGLIKYAGPNEPRFDHRYVNGEIESLGLLVEEQRTNLFTRSEEINSTHFGGGGIFGADTILNPYGQSASISYVTTSERVRGFNASGYSTLALSFFSKKRFGGLERDYTRIEIFQVEISGGSLGSYDFNFNGNNSDGTYFKDIKTEEYPNGWYRFSCRLVARTDYNSGTFATNSRFDIEGGFSDNYVWGIQIEPASFATSYIPTEGSTKTRNPDNASITGSNFTEWYNQSEGTVYCSLKTLTDTPDQYSNAWELQKSDNTDRLFVRYPNYVGWECQGQTDLYLTRAFSQNAKMATAYKTNDTTFAVNSSYAQDISVTIGETKDELWFGSSGSGNYLNGTISQLTYYPTRLTNSQLVSLTR